MGQVLVEAGLPPTLRVADAAAPMGQVTQLLRRLHAGDQNARNALFTVAYKELRRMARALLRDGGRNAALDTITVVHDSYLRVQAAQLRAVDRRGFFAYASKVMRSVILDRVRERKAQRRGADAVHLTLSTELVSNLTNEDPMIQKLHEALEDLEQADARLAQVVQMHYFHGYSVKELAQMLRVNERTVQRDLEKARLILAAALR
jgi:RNA polymerase sigma factor (TIGR02999 family)